MFKNLLSSDDIKECLIKSGILYSLLSISNLRLSLLNILFSEESTIYEYLVSRELLFLDGSNFNVENIRL